MFTPGVSLFLILLCVAQGVWWLAMGKWTGALPWLAGALRVALLALLCAGCATGDRCGSDGAAPERIDDRSVISLWPAGTAGVDGTRRGESKPCGKRFFNIHDPTITVYKPTEANGIAIVLCPGGGYNIVAAGIEGEPVAERLNAAGITVFVLKYRLPNTPGADFKHPLPLSDALRALQLVRHRAAQFGVDSGRIGIMGFSAGGHLASMAGTLFAEYTFGSDDLSRVSARPDFMCLVYPVISTQGAIAHRCPQSLVRHRADDQSLARLSSESNVTDETPPTFLVHARDDGAVHYENSVVMHRALKRNNVPSELKLYATGGHGFGPGRAGDDSAAWIDDFVAWLHKEKEEP